MTQDKLCIFRYPVTSNNDKIVAVLDIVNYAITELNEHFKKFDEGDNFSTERRNHVEYLILR
jgi:hypothetical protein